VNLPSVRLTRGSSGLLTRGGQTVHLTNGLTDFGGETKGTLVFFVHPKDMGGVLTEIMETPKAAH